MQNNTFSGLIIGQNVITLDRVASTNDYFKDNLSKFTPQDEGTAILAVEQFAGKGQRGNVWLSEPGKNIMTSILLYPKFLAIEEQFALSTAIAVGLLKWLKTKTNKLVSIKWPNDIYIDNDKIAGILIENSIKGSVLASSIVGIGININQTAFSNLAHITSLKEANQQEEDYDLQLLSQELFQYLTIEYQSLAQGNHSHQNIILNNNLFRKNEFHKFVFNQEQVDAMILQVLRNGQLEIQVKSKRLTLNSKEIKYIL